MNASTNVHAVRLAGCVFSSGEGAAALGPRASNVQRPTAAELTLAQAEVRHPSEPALDVPPQEPDATGEAPWRHVRCQVHNVRHPFYAVAPQPVGAPNTTSGGAFERDFWTWLTAFDFTSANGMG